MLYAFTDESYSPRKYFQAAYVVNETGLPQIEDAREELLHLVHSLGFEGNVEFHGHALMNSKDEWKPLTGKFQLKVKIFKYFVRLVTQLEGFLIIEGVNIDESHERKVPLLSPHHETSRNLLLSINNYAGTLQSEVQIYSDKISKEDRKRIQFDTISANYSYPWINSVSFVESSKYFGIQITDMCVYLYRRMVDHQETNPITRILIEELWGTLEPLIQSERIL